MKLEQFLEKHVELAKKVNELSSDEQRLEFLKNNSDKLKVVLDNDCSSICFIDSELQELLEEKYNISLEWFDDYHGRDDGIIKLFKFAWIRAESC